MKHFLYFFIFLLITCPIWGQHQFENRSRHPQHTFQHPYHKEEIKHIIDFSGKKDFNIPILQNTKASIRMDSTFFTYYDYMGFLRKEILKYNSNGNIQIAYYQVWDFGTGDWINYSLSTYSYDINAILQTRLDQSLENNIWVNDRLVSYSFDANGNELSNLRQSWENGIWVNDYLNSYTYNNNGNRLTESHQYWENSSWVNNHLYTLTYDNNGNMLTNLYVYWYNGIIEDSSLNTCTYDANGNFLTSLNQDWKNNSWVNFSKQTVTYDANDNWLSSLYQRWVNNAWVNQDLRSYTYDANGSQLTYLKQKWTTSGWENLELYSSTFLANGNILKRLCQNWENGAWLNVYLTNYTFDNNDNIQTILIQDWENNTWVNSKKAEYEFLPGNARATAFEWDASSWIESLSNFHLNILIEGEFFLCYGIDIELYYSEGSGIDEQDASLSNSPIHCYPNPVKDQLNIKLDEALQVSNYRIEFFSQTGKKVKTIEISADQASSSTSFSLEDLPSGLYIMSVFYEKEIFSQKILISK